MAQNLQTIKTYLTLELARYCKNCSTFSLQSLRVGYCLQQVLPNFELPVFAPALAASISCV